MWNNSSDGKRKIDKCVQVIWECKTDCRRKKDKKKGKIGKPSITFSKKKQNFWRKGLELLNISHIIRSPCNLQINCMNCI